MSHPYDKTRIRGEDLILAAYPQAKRAAVPYPLEAMDIVAGARLRVVVDAHDGGVTLRLVDRMPGSAADWAVDAERLIPAADITHTSVSPYEGLGNVVEAIREMVEPILTEGVTDAAHLMKEFSRVAEDVTAWCGAAGHDVDFKEAPRPAVWKTEFRWRGEHPPRDGDVCWLIPYAAPAYYPQMSAPQLARIEASVDKGVTRFRARIVCTRVAFAPNGSALIPEVEHDGILPHAESSDTVLPRNADTDALIRLLVDTRAGWHDEGIRHKAVSAAVGAALKEVSSALAAHEAEKAAGK